MTDNFGLLCNRLIGEYNDNMKILVEESTKTIFELALKKPNLQIKRTIRNQISIGKFYLIKYNYNGNKLWCPIFVIDDRYSPELQKRIIYAVNLSYLPFKYKILYFDKLFKTFSTEIEKNRLNNDGDGSVNDEIPLKINFESVYKSLKNNGEFNYAITAFDYTKIDGMDKGEGMIYTISTTILYRFIFIDVKMINGKIMMDYLKESEREREKEIIKEILIAYDKNLQDFDNDTKEYYQKLRLIENHYKFYENPR
jgi:hypothetical protein